MGEKLKLTFYQKFNFKTLIFLISGFFSAVRKRWWRPQSFYYDNYQYYIFMEWQFGLRIILSKDIDETQSATRQRKKEDTRAWKAFHVRNRIPSYRQCQLTAGIGNWFGYNHVKRNCQSQKQYHWTRNQKKTGVLNSSIYLSLNLENKMQFHF